MCTCLGGVTEGVWACVHLIQLLLVRAHRARCASLGGCSSPKTNGLRPPSGRGGRAHGALAAAACFGGATWQPPASWMPLRKGLEEEATASPRGEGRASIGGNAQKSAARKGDEGGGEPVRAEAASLLRLRSGTCRGNPSPWHCLS